MKDVYKYFIGYMLMFWMGYLYGIYGELTLGIFCTLVILIIILVSKKKKGKVNQKLIKSK